MVYYIPDLVPWAEYSEPRHWQLNDFLVPFALHTIMQPADMTYRIAALLIGTVSSH